MTTTDGPARPHRIPERQCVACRAMVPRTAMLRVVRTPEGAVVLDLDQRVNGRGAYVCKTPECVKQAARRGGFQRSLRRPVPTDLIDRIVVLGTVPGSEAETKDQGL